MTKKHKKIIVISTIVGTLFIFTGISLFLLNNSDKTMKNNSKVNKSNTLNIKTNTNDQVTENEIKQREEREKKIADSSFNSTKDKAGKRYDDAEGGGYIPKGYIPLTNRNKLIGLNYINLDQAQEIERKFMFSLNQLTSLYKAKDNISQYYSSNKLMLDEYFGISSEDQLKSFTQQIDFVKNSKSISSSELLNDGLSKQGDTINCKIKVKTDDNQEHIFNVSFTYTDSYRNLSVKIS